MNVLRDYADPGSIRADLTSGLAAVGCAAAFALTAGAAPLPASAQDGGVTELAGIVIEGTTLGGDSVEAATQGTAVSVVTAQDLEERQIRTASEALRSLPGVAVNQSNGPTGLTVVRMRGAEANHTLVLIDGIEANQTSDGAFDFSHLPADQIERIEVIRGPQSGLYGSNAIGGVINIITKGGAGPLRVSVRGEAGAFDTTDAGISVSGGSEALYAAVTYNERTTAGYNIAPEGSERDGGTRRAFSFKGGARVNDHVAFDASFRDINIEGERDTDGFTGPFSVQTDNPNFFASHVRLAHLGVKLDFLDGRWTHRVRVTGNETRVEDTSFSSFTPDGAFFATESDAYKYHYTTTMRLDGDGFAGTRHFLTGLVENEHERFTPVSQDNIQRGRERWSYAAEYRGEFWEALNLSATVRYDDSDSFDDFTTWRTSGSWRVPETGLRLHASAGTGIKYPTMFEQFGSLADFIPNPNLAVEESFGWDAGAEVTMLDERLVVDVTYFEADLTNEIETVFLPFGDPRCGAIGALFCSTVANREGDSERRGIEVQARAMITPDLSLSTAYTWLDATEPDGSVEIRRPEHSGRLDLNYAFAEGRGKLHVSAAYNGEAEDDAFALPFFTPTRVKLDDYWLVSLAGSYRIRENIELFGRVENALDEDYQEVFGFETAGLAAYGGVRITLEDMTALADAGQQ